MMTLTALGTKDRYKLKDILCTSIVLKNLEAMFLFITTKFACVMN
jgi:hypothetical protein